MVNSSVFYNFAKQFFAVKGRYFYRQYFAAKITAAAFYKNALIVAG